MHLLSVEASVRDSADASESADAGKSRIVGTLLDPQKAQIFSKEAGRPGSAKFRLKAADCHGHSKASSE